MHAVVAAGCHLNIRAAAEVLGKLKLEVVGPIPTHQHVYEHIYADYTTLYDYFARGVNDVMKRLKRLRIEATGSHRAFRACSAEETT